VSDAEELKALKEPQPRIGVAALVEKNDAMRPCVLLGLSKKIKGRARWVIPGGGLRRGETFAACAKREIREETGIEVSVLSLGGVDAHELITKKDHRVVVIVNARPVDGAPAPVPGDDLEDVGWFSRAQIEAGEPDLTAFTKKILKQEGWL
jgi:8-oxo-dGTP diphosphatase